MRVSGGKTASGCESSVSAFSCPERVAGSSASVTKTEHKVIKWCIYSLICNLLYYFCIEYNCRQLSDWDGKCKKY